MLWVVPPLVGAIVGLWAGALLYPYVPMSVALLLPSIFGMAAVVNIWGQKAEQRLSDLEKITIDDGEVQRRLHERVGARRSRYAAKRIVLFVVGVVPTLGVAAPFVQLPPDILEVALLPLWAAGGFCLVGNAILIYEASALENRFSEIQSYARRVQKGRDEVKKRRAAADKKPQAA